jgi:hypothetical protein
MYGPARGHLGWRGERRQFFGLRDPIDYQIDYYRSDRRSDRRTDGFT